VRRIGKSSGTVTPQKASCGETTISAEREAMGAAPKNDSLIASRTLDTDGKSMATSSDSQSARPCGRPDRAS
jgi:hypothetical protein